MYRFYCGGGIKARTEVAINASAATIIIIFPIH